MVGQLAAPPLDGNDVCPLCHSWREPDRSICDSCEQTGSTVGYPIGPPSVITLYRKPSDLRDWLTRYKGRPGNEDDPFDQACFDRVQALLGRYLLEHADAVTQAIGAVDGLVVVPSGGSRLPPHPLGSVIDRLGIKTPVLRLLKRGPGHLDYRQSAVDGYIPAVQHSPARVLLVEDVFVTGARLFSAARALLDAGHIVVGSLVLARRVNLSWGGCQQLWDRQVRTPFNWQDSPVTTRSTPVLLDRLRVAEGHE